MDCGDFASEPRSRVREVLHDPAADERLGVFFVTAVDGTADWDQGIGVGSRGVPLLLLLLLLLLLVFLFLLRVSVPLSRLRDFPVVVLVCVRQVALTHCLLAFEL